jgi:hypothetical protein
MVELNHEPIVDECAGCDYVITGPEPGPSHCSKCLVPAARWRGKKCNLASHVLLIVGKAKPLNPLKASKRAMEVKK